MGQVASIRQALRGQDRTRGTLLQKTLLSRSIVERGRDGLDES